MTNRPTSSSSAPPPPAGHADNAFAAEFLAGLMIEDDPPSALAAELVGPWVVRRLPEGGYGLFRYWESPRAGDRPHARFSERSPALIAAAVLPTLAGDGPWRIASDPDLDGGFALFAGGEVCGRLEVFDDAFISAMNVAHELLARPDALALLLAAAGPTALELAGRRLTGAVEEGRRSAAGP